MAKYIKILNFEMRDALGVATIAVRDSAKRRAFPARKVSASDSETKKERRFAGRTPVRKKIIRAENKGQISAVPYYTYARTKAIQNLLTQFGKRENLTRKGLVVYRPWINLSKLIYFDFRTDRALKQWAIKRKMISKHKLFVDDPRVINALLLRPAMRRENKLIQRTYQGAFIRAGVRL